MYFNMLWLVMHCQGHILDFMSSVDETEHPTDSKVFLRQNPHLPHKSSRFESFKAKPFLTRPILSLRRSPRVHIMEEFATHEVINLSRI